MAAPSVTARENTVRSATASSAPKACAVSPVVPIRRKPNSQNVTLIIIDPTAMAPMKLSAPRWPAIAVSHKPSSGTVILLSIAGTLSRIISLLILISAC